MSTSAVDPTNALPPLALSTAKKPRQSRAKRKRTSSSPTLTGKSAPTPPPSPNILHGFNHDLLMGPVGTRVGHRPSSRVHVGLLTPPAQERLKHERLRRKRRQDSDNEDCISSTDIGCLNVLKRLSCSFQCGGSRCSIKKSRACSESPPSSSEGNEDLQFVPSDNNTGTLQKSKSQKRQNVS